MKRKVSVLMPSRNRVELAEKSIDSLGWSDKFEVILVIDPDEPQKQKYMRLTSDNVSVIISSIRYGYGALHEYYNLSSERATGDWLMLWNDDAIMETPNWVDIVANYDYTIPQVLNVWSQEIDNLFPLISRKWYEIVGHFSLNTHADSWVQQIGERLGNQVNVPDIKISHHGEDLHDHTHTEVRQVVRQTSFNYRKMEHLRIADANKIQEWLNENNYAV